MLIMLPPWPQFIFGFGRRRCPGLHLGEASIWYLVASMLATLRIEKPIGLNGKAIEPDVQYKNSIFRYVSYLS